MQCGQGADDCKQKRDDAGANDTPTSRLRGFELLRALYESGENFFLKIRIRGKGKSAQAGDGTAAVVCVFLARDTRVEVFAKRLLFPGRDLTRERSE
jgi:hypothetical protein